MLPTGLFRIVSEVDVQYVGKLSHDTCVAGVWTVIHIGTWSATLTAGHCMCTANMWPFKAAYLPLADRAVSALGPREDSINTGELTAFTTLTTCKTLNTKA